MTPLLGVLMMLAAVGFAVLFGLTDEANPPVVATT